MRPVELAVRPLRAEEWLRLRAFRVRALESDPLAFGATLDEALAEADSVWQARAAAAAEGKERVYMLAERDGAWLGMAAGLRLEDGLAELQAMWVAPEARRLGAGQRIIESVCAWAREAGAKRIVLWVNAANEPALALYARCGFAPASEPRPGTRHPERRYQMMARDL